MQVSVLCVACRGGVAWHGAADDRHVVWVDAARPVVVTVLQRDGDFGRAVEVARSMLEEAVA